MDRHPIVVSRQPVSDRTSWPPIVLVSNRGPIEHHVADGVLAARRGSGGVVTALDGLARQAPGTWVAAALTEGDRQAARRGWLAPVAGYAMGNRLVALDATVARRHYSRFSNPLLWFLQHGLANVLAEQPVAASVARDWLEGYVPANRAMADAAICEALMFGVPGNAPPVISVHDYQLYLVPRFVRAALPHVPIQHFVHIPWPEPAAWRALPTPIVQSICESLLACDVVGFQTADCGHRFVETCLDVVPGARCPASEVVVWRGWTTRVAGYPISVDVELLRRQAADPVCQGYRGRLAAGWTGQTIVRVDRVDPSKNLLRGFAAYDRLLRRRPDWHGRVRLLSFLVPSRSAIPEYRTYAEAVLAAIDAINATHGNASWQPIQLFHENNYLQALAGMAIADVLFVNPIADGMNLVAKEGAVVNERDAVLVLSHGAGAYRELGLAALGVPPDDVDATSDALEQALTMPPAERRKRASWLRTHVERNDVHQWLTRRYADLFAVASSPARRLRAEFVPIDSSLPGTDALAGDLSTGALRE